MIQRCSEIPTYNLLKLDGSVGVPRQAEPIRRNTRRIKPWAGMLSPLQSFRFFQLGEIVDMHREVFQVCSCQLVTLGRERQICQPVVQCNRILFFADPTSQMIKDLSNPDEAS